MAGLKLEAISNVRKTFLNVNAGTKLGKRCSCILVNKITFIGSLISFSHFRHSDTLHEKNFSGP